MEICSIHNKLENGVTVFNSLRRHLSSPLYLTEKDLSEKFLIHIDFHDVILDKSSFRRSNLASANFQNACMRDVDLSGACLFHANMAKANLEGANLSNASLYLAHLNDANLSQADLSHSDLSHANLLGANFEGVDLRGAILHESTFDNSIFNADLRGARFSFLENTVVVANEVDTDLFEDKKKYSNLLRKIFNKVDASSGSCYPNYVLL